MLSQLSQIFKVTTVRELWTSSKVLGLEFGVFPHIWMALIWKKVQICFSGIGWLFCYTSMRTVFVQRIWNDLLRAVVLVGWYCSCQLFPFRCIAPNSSLFCIYLLLFLRILLETYLLFEYQLRTWDCLSVWQELTETGSWTDVGSNVLSRKNWN